MDHFPKTSSISETEKNVTSSILLNDAIAAGAKNNIIAKDISENTKKSASPAEIDQFGERIIQGARQDDPWWKDKHSNLVKRAHEGNIDMLFLGDSITDWMNTDLLHKDFGDGAVNFGIAGDKAEDLLYRLKDGELNISGKEPRLVTVLIGTNNLSTTSNEDIEKRVELNLEEIRKQLPDSKILLLGILPRDEMPDTEFRKRIAETNALYKQLADGKNIFYADIGKEMLEPDGKISTKVMYDFLHPTQDEGYSRMYNAIKTYADRILAPTSNNKS
jgi:beta-glucosidase